MRTKKKIAIVLVLSFLFAAGYVAPMDKVNNGTIVSKAEDVKLGGEDGDQAGDSADQAYKISNAAQLFRMCELINSGAVNKSGRPYSECYYELTEDITVIDGTVTLSENATKAVFKDSDGNILTADELQGKSWTSILNFGGQLDGKGFSISGLYITGFNTGLFNNMQRMGIVQNLTIKNSVIAYTGFPMPGRILDFFKGYSWIGNVNECHVEWESCCIGALAATEPVVTEPVATEPTVTEPAVTEPATTKPVTTEPATTEPATTEPVTTEPATTEPAVTNPAATEPVTTEPATTEPTTNPADIISVDPPREVIEYMNTAHKGDYVETKTASYLVTEDHEVKITSVNVNNMKADGTFTVPDWVTVKSSICKVTSVGSGAFAGNKNIKKIKLGKNVTTIGKGAFKNCTSLKSVTFPSGLKTLSDQAFYNCRKLKAVKLPASVKTIGKAAFKNCVSMKKFAVGKKVPKKAKGKNLNAAASAVKKISIGTSALENCTKLRQIVINSQVRRIGNAAFRKCKSLADILVYSLKLQYVGKKALKGVSDCKISVPKKKLNPYTKLFRNKGQGKKVTVAKL